MKILQLFFLLFITFSYSQGFCEYGDYDFLFNTIKGIDKTKFKKIELKKKDQSIYIESYDSGKLISSNYNETIGGYMLSMDNHCYAGETVEQKKMEYEYKYFENEEIKKVNVYLENELEDEYFFEYNNKNNIKKIESEYVIITHDYYENGLLKNIIKNEKTYYYQWNLLKKIEKIKVVFPSSSYSNHIYFKYNSDQTINKITTEFYDTFTKKKTTETEKVFCYKNKKLQKIVLTGFEITKNKKEKIDSVFYEYNYDNDDKLIINVLDNDKKYIEHFECYY